MNTKELTSELAERLGYTQKDATQLVASLVDVMTKELVDEHQVVIQGFGSFEVKKKMERIAINPVTQQRMLVPPKLLLNFRPHPLLKDKLKKHGANG